MTLNSKQLKIVIVSVVLFIVMGLYPPWIDTYDARSIHSENPAGYAFIIEPPEQEKYNVQYGVRLDASRLFVQWVTLIVATVGAILLAKGSHKK